MHWRSFDRKLFIQKLARLSRDLQRKTQDAANRVRDQQRRIGQGKGASFYAKLVDAHLDVLGQRLELVDRTCREVWEVQGGILTPEFVRRVIRDDAVFTTIAARCASIQAQIELMAKRTGFTNLTPALRHLAMERRRLESDWSNRYEIEANELGWRERRTVPVAQAPNFAISAPSDRQAIGDGEEAIVLVGDSGSGPMPFLEDAGPTASKTPVTAVSYPKFRTKRLQKLLRRTEDRIENLKDHFPDWRTCGDGYGPGNEPPDFYKEIRRLERDREQIILALSSRRNLGDKLKQGAATALETSISFPNSSGRRTSPRRNPEVAKRRVLVRSHSDVMANEMCEIFDREGVQLPSKWKQAGFETWCRAYLDRIFRKRIHVLITKDRTSR